MPRFPRFLQHKHDATPPELLHLTEEFLKPLSSIVGFDQLVPSLCSKLHEHLNASSVFIVLFEPITNRYVGKDARGIHREMLSEFSFSHTAKLMRWLGVNMTPFDAAHDDEVRRFLVEEERSLLSRARVALVVPLIVVNRLTGALFIGERSDGRPYSQSQLNALVLVANQSALAIEHALMYQFQEDKLRRLFRAESLATMGELAAGAAHEIRNPLTSIRSTVQYLQKEIPEAKRGLVDGIIEEVDRIDAIIKGLLSFSRSSELHVAPVDIGEVISQTLMLLESELRLHSITARWNYRSTQKAVVLGDAAQLKQVFLNILLNGVQAMPEGGNLEISLDDPSPGVPTIAIKIRDNGCGIPDTDLPHVFDPFFTNKESGTGLGLSISYGIVGKHGGEIEIASTTEGPDRGTVVTVRLPAAGGG